MRYRLAIFDSDGTLADTLPWMRSVFNELAAEHGFRKVEEHEYGQFRDLQGRALLKALDLPLWKMPRVLSSMRARMAQHTGDFTLFAGMRETLHALADGGMKLGVVSSNSQANVERVLGPETARLIAHYDCSASMFGKAAKIRAVVRQSGVSREQTIYIGDETRDAEAARKAGVAFGAAAWGQHSADALRAENPAEFFSSVPELAEKLCR
jgi:phosphoglycolate phosphatase